MTLRFLRYAIPFLALASGLSLLAEEPGKCSATARECEVEIRQMLSGRRYLGARIEDMTPGPGVVIKAITSDGPAAHVDLQPGDRIIAVNGKSLMYGSVRDYKSIVAEVKDNGGMLFMIVDRHGSYKRIVVRLWPFPQAQLEKIIAAHLSRSHGAAAGSQQ